MTDYIDREMAETKREITDLFTSFKTTTRDAQTAAILTLAAVTHHQNGMKP